MEATFFTPSYAGDLDRAIWMRRSIRRFLNASCRHILAVPRRDHRAFARAFRDDADVELVLQEDAVASIFYPDLMYRVVKSLAPSQCWRLAARHGGRPGWVVQQIVKLNCTMWIDAGAVLFVDSDLVFTRPFSLADLGITDGPRTLVRITPPREDSKHREHINRSRQILGLLPGESEHHYMAYPAIWYVDWLSSLHEHLEQQTPASWQQSLHAANLISEYTIYGLFVEELLRPQNLEIRSQPFHRIVHDESSYFALVRNSGDSAWCQQDDHLTLVVQSNLHIPVCEYEAVLDAILQ